MYTPYPQDFEADLVRDKCVYLPLYLLDHSGLFLSTESFHDPWDSGQIGWIWASLKSIREEYGWKNVTQKRRKAVLGRLQAEVNEYNQWLTGDVYCFEIFDAAGDGVDGMCGWYGYDNCLEAAYEAVAEIIAGKEEDAETWATIQEELHVVL